MPRKCTNCGLALQKGVLKCPKCGKRFSALSHIVGTTIHPSPIPVPEPQDQPNSDELNYLSQKVDMLASELHRVREDVEGQRRSKESLTDIIFKSLEVKVNKRIMLVSGLMLASLILFFSIGLFAMLKYSTSDKIIQDSVEKKFASYSADDLFVEMVESASSALMKNDVIPVIEKIKAESTGYQDSLFELRKELEEDKSILQQEISLLKDRSKVMRFADLAIQGDRQGYEELLQMKALVQEEQLVALVDAYILHIESYFRSVNRYEDAEISFEAPSGLSVSNSSIPTKALIHAMERSPHWKIRAKAADLLGKRSEPGTIDALLEAASKDPSLDVVMSSLRSFSNLSGYKGEGLFDVHSAKAWWQSFGLNVGEGKPGFRKSSAASETITLPA